MIRHQSNFMARDTQDIVLQEVFKISSVLGGINSIIESHDVILERIEGQTTRTNGRVTKLEDVTSDLATMMKKQDEMLIELKKKISGDDSELKKTAVQGGIEIRKIVWGGVITITVTLTTLILTKIL